MNNNNKEHILVAWNDSDVPVLIKDKAFAGKLTSKPTAKGKILCYFVFKILIFKNLFISRKSTRRQFTFEKETRFKKAKHFAYKGKQRRVRLFKSSSRISICKWS